ncbi:MAG TPA: hypothetical protein VEQ58_15525 [Polyangiaceae bacterium]|nr:hypothetical protein [Polyangiaceae bacterium]
MFDGAYLTLLIGPGVPAPPPQPVLEALEGIQVTSSGRERSGFQLTFSLGKTSLLANALLPAGYLDPIVTRVIIIVTLRGLPTVLMDGIVTRHELSPSNQPGQSKLTITGEDLTVLMDIVQVQLAYPAMPDSAIVAAILAKYAAFGIVPLIIPPLPADAPDSPTQRFNHHCGTDLEYIRTLASNCGYVFYLQPGPAPFTSVAYFGPDLPVPVMQPALSVNLDAHSNVESLTFSLNGTAKGLFVFTVFDPVTHKIPIPIPVPDVNPTHPPLGARPTPPAKVTFPGDLSGLSTMEAAKRVLGLLSRSGDQVTANGSLDVLRYGHILMSRTVIGVRGASLTYDGMYYVNSVTHSLKRGEYKQNFTLSRDFVVTNTPAVLP